MNLGRLRRTNLPSGAAVVALDDRDLSLTPGLVSMGPVLGPLGPTQTHRRLRNVLADWDLGSGEQGTRVPHPRLVSPRRSPLVVYRRELRLLRADAPLPPPSGVLRVLLRYIQACWRCVDAAPSHLPA